MSVAAPKRTAPPARALAPEHTEPREPISIEAVLVDRLRAGDHAAEAELFRRYRDRLWHQAWKVVRNAALADEIVQEAWINGIEAIHRFEGRSTFATWITAIVRNEARDKRKSEARSRPFSDLVHRNRHGLHLRREGSPDEQPGSLLSVDDQTPERLFLEKEVRARFHDALRSLSPTERKVLVLRDLRGATPSEACTVLQLSDGAHRVHLCRARARVRRLLKEDSQLPELRDGDG